MGLLVQAETMQNTFECLLEGAMAGQMKDYASAANANARGDFDEAQAHRYLLEDLAPVEAAVNRMVDAPLSQAQFDALCSLTFNIGIGALARSTLLRLLNGGDYAGAAAQFGRWNRAGKQILPGLIARREAERAMFVA
mgnify:CR=1 FL=1